MATKTITIANRKGGVAKTTTVVTLGHGLALRGRPAVLVDADPQGQLGPSLGLGQEPGLFDLLVGGRPLRNVARLARPDLWLVPGDKRTETAQRVLAAEEAKADTLARAVKGPVNGEDPAYIILDTAPSAGRLQEMALWAADLVIIPSACDFLSLAGLADLVGALADLGARGWRGRLLGILPTFYDEVTRESKTNLEELVGAYGELVLPAIHRGTILRECAAEGRTVWELAPESRAAREYTDLVERVIHATSTGSFGRSK